MRNRPPSFVIDATDPLAAGIVEEYAKRYRARIAKTTGAFTKEQSDRHIKLIYLASDMRNWHTIHGQNNAR